MSTIEYQKTETDIALNPGYKLREILVEIFPKDHSNTFLLRIDHLLNAENSFYDISYYSTLNYLIRRLINTAIYLKKKYNSPEYNAERFIKEIRFNLRNDYNFPSAKIEAILLLILQCIRENERDLSDGNKNVIKRKAEKANYGCYICGKPLIYNKHGYDKDNPDLVEVEHLWPKALGGSNEAFNLEVCCHQCNQNKKNYIDEYDYHFEGISVKSDEHESNFSSEFNQISRVATALKNGPECIICGKLALHQNQLQYKRDKKQDSWHYFNINTYCEKHAKNK